MLDEDLEQLELNLKTWTDESFDLLSDLRSERGWPPVSPQQRISPHLYGGVIASYANARTVSHCIPAN